MNCPSCESAYIKLNGHIHNGKQNYKCKTCGRQFVSDSENNIISPETKSLVEKLLLERIFLAGVCRIADVSAPWLQGFIGELYASQPDDLNADLPTAKSMSEHLEDKFDEYAYSIAGLKKTLIRLSLASHGRILSHLGLDLTYSTAH
jgi:hypothetical protein